jgi:hypothetical protein
LVPSQQATRIVATPGRDRAAAAAVSTSSGRSASLPLRHCRDGLATGEVGLALRL